MRLLSETASAKTLNLRARFLYPGQSSAFPALNIAPLTPYTVHSAYRSPAGHPV